MKIKIFFLLVLLFSPEAFTQSNPPPFGAFRYSSGSWVAAATTSIASPLQYTPPAAAIYCYNAGTNQWIPADASCFGSGSGTVNSGTVGQTAGYSANGNVVIGANSAFNVLLFGAKGDTRMVSDASITQGSSTLTSATAVFTSADTGKSVSVAMGPNAVTNGTYTSGVTATGSTGQTCTLTTSNGGGSGGTATLYLTGTNTIAGGSTLYFTAFGTGYTSAPTSATVASGSATCSGTAVISTTLHPLPVLTTATYVNATTITLGVAATNTVSSSYMSIGTDDTTAIQNAINLAQTAKGAVYFPGGSAYWITGLTASSAVTLKGDGVTSVNSGSGQNNNTPPYLLGSVLWMALSGTDAVKTTVVSQGVNIRDLGIVFDPSLAYFATGDGFNAAVTGDAWGIQHAKWERLKVWGVDGNHYAFHATNQNQLDADELISWGGGTLKFNSTSGAACCAGNGTVAAVFGVNDVGGTSDGINITAAGANNENLITLIRPEVNILSAATAVGFPWAPANNISYRLGFNIPSNVTNITVIGPDQEAGNNPVYPYNGSFALLNQQPGTNNFSYIPAFGQSSRPNSLIGQSMFMPLPCPTFTTIDTGAVALGCLHSSTGFQGTGILMGMQAGANDAWALTNPTGYLYFNHVTNSTQAVAAIMTPPATTGTPEFRVYDPFYVGVTQFTVAGTGCTPTANASHTGTAGTFTLAAGPCTAVTVTLNGAQTLPAFNGWTCQAHDRTAPTVLIGGESSSNAAAGTVTFTIPSGAGTSDVIAFSCTAY